MKLKRFEKGFCISSKHKALEINWNYWNPLKHIGFQRSFDLWLKGDHSPHLCIYWCFICISIEIEWYDNRHEDER